VQAIAFVNLHRPSTAVCIRFQGCKRQANAPAGCKCLWHFRTKSTVGVTFTTPHVLKALNKGMLPVYWKWNRRAWGTQEIILDWYTSYFCPTVLLFLLLDNGPGHPANLAEIRTPLDVSVLFMPSHTSLLQPTD
jgi:hypothetical protein